MDELRKLYQVLAADKYITVSFEEFESAFKSDPLYKNQIYNVLSQENRVDIPKEQFFAQFSGPSETQKAFEAQAKAEVYGADGLKKKDTALSSEVGSSVSKETPKPDWSWYKTTLEQQTQRGQEGDGAFRSPLAKPFIPQREQANVPEVLKPPAVVREEYKQFKEAQQERAFKLQKDIADAEKKSFQESVDENKKWIESNAVAQQDPNFLASLEGITPGLIGNEESDVVNTLTKTLSKYGFTFQPTGIGDALLVRTADGLNEIEIDLDPFFSSTENSESEKLKKFIKANAQPAVEYRGEDFISKASRAKAMRDKGMVNDDGSFSTVKFAQYEQDGKFYVVPTLFPKDPFNYGVSKNDWMELPLEDAIKVATSRGEIFEFNNEKDAKDFSEGAWKDVDAYDVEGEKFYKERGLDYYNEKKKWREYTNAQDEIELIDKITDNPGTITPQEKERFKKYFSPDGRPLYGSDKLSEFRGTLEETRDNLQGQVFDASFFKSDGTIQKAREDFDFVLAEKQSKLVREAVDVNKKSKAFVDELNEFSLTRFNTPIEYINNIVPKTEEDAIDLDVLKQKYVVAKAAQKDAAFKFEMGKTYYNAKWNKEATTEYDENISGFINAVSDAWNNGQAAEAILSATLGIDDMGNLEDRQEVARKIVENLSQLSGKQSKIMSRINLAREGEFSKAFFADPFEATTTLVATSFAQMIPLGLTIIPRTVSAGASAGAAIGAAGGSLAGGVGAVPGAIGGATTGAGLGFKTGIAATSFALEYTNSIMDTMREKGYDLLDPKQVEAALMDDAVWEEGGQRGVARGIPIALVDALSAGLAGRVFKVSKLASTPTKIAAQVGERIVYDPLAEGFGEFAAQVSAGQDVNMNEVVMESLGGFGSNTTSMAINMMKDARSNTSIKIAHDLTNIQNVAKETVSDERISQWANNMHQLGKIDADVNQRIQENVGLRRQAREVLSVDGTKPKSTKAEARAMELLSAREMLSRTPNLKQINSRKISQINEELAAMGETKDVVDADKQVNLDAVLGTTRQGVSHYQLNGKILTKDKFLEAVNNMTDKQLAKAKYKVSNDTDTQTTINNKVNAIQKQSAGAVPVQPKAGVSETMEEGKPQAKPQVAAEEVVKEEVTQATDEIVSSKTRLDEIADVLPEKVAYTAADLDNFASLEQDKAEGVLSGLADKVASGIALDDKEQIVYDNNKQRVDELSDLASEKIALEESVSDLEAMISESQPAPAPDELEKFNQSIGRVKEEVDTDKDEQTLLDLGNKIIAAKKAIATADDTDAAIEELKKSQKEKDDFEKSIQKRKEFNEVNYLIDDEIYNSKKDNYEYQELFNQDPRLAAIQSTKDMLEFAKENKDFLDEKRVAVYENDIRMLEEDIAKFPVKERKVEFRTEEVGVETEVAQDEVDAITEQINAMTSGNTLTSLSPEAKQPEVDTIDLNKRVENPIPTVRIELVDGIPVVFTISDQLTAGTVTNPDTGREITDLYGGIGFNGRNANAAWAYTSEKNANTTLTKAQKVYKANKPTFEEFWKNNPAYNGLVPMMVVKMGEGSILSNEATARVLADNISEFPIANRERALQVLSKDLRAKIKSLRERAASSKNELTKRNYNKSADGYQNILDLIAENNLQKIDDVLQPEIFKQINNLNTRKELMTIIGYGNPNPPRVTKKAGKPSKDSLVTRAIVGIPAAQDNKDINPNKRYELMNLANVVNTITETTIADVDNRSIIGIVGIDVLNPQVLNTENGDFTHPNYQYGLNGRVIGILEQPVALVEAYPEAYNLALQELIKAESKFVKPKQDGKKIIKPGNRLFNQSIPEVAEIADRYFQRAFGRERPKFYGTRSIDKERAKRISDAFIKIVDNPTAPDVRKAYEAMARETLEQYKLMLEAGYFVEINNDEPYGNSREMVEDLRTNKRMKIFSTESGFGDEKITPEQRDQNVLLRESGFYDVSGQPLLVNDVFRAVHDFFGHAELGNSFGPVGEENAWNVHARMYSPLARQAMTTETRGQNSYVNFSGVNERVESMRQEAANLRNQGKLAEAEAIVSKIYEEVSFAEQKQGILPEEFWTIDTKDIGDAEFIPSSVSDILTMGLGVQNGLTQQDFVGAVANDNISDATKLTNFLNIAFPSVIISTDKVSFNTIMNEVGTEMYMRGDQVIYGVTVDGDIYINPDVHNSESALFNTTIHEFGHVWTDYLQGSKKGKQIYARGVQLVEEAVANDENVKKIFDAQMKKYPGNRARAINETMAILIGNKGEVIVNAGIKSKFKEWLLGVWRFVKENFKMSKNLTEQEIQNLTLDEFIGTALADIFSGKEIKLTAAEKKAIKNPNAMFSSTQSMNSIISQGRANGFSDAAIKQVLINRGFKASDVNAALAVQVDVFTELPREFANVDGGVVQGMQLFNEVKTELNNWANTAEDVTYGEMRQKAMDLMKANPIFQAQPDTTQMELLSAFDRTLNTRANVNVQRQITQIKNNLRQRKIGANELQQAKIVIKNLIRSVLPKSSTYTQAQINKLITIINNATKDSILADTEKVMAIVEHQREKMKNAVLKDMFELVSKKSKPAMTTTGKRRTGGVDAKGQAFFAAVKPILRAAIKNDINYMSQVANELAQADADGTLNEAILKEQRGEALTVKEQELLNKAYAFDTFADVLSMDLEEVQDLMSTLETERAEAIMRLKTRRQVRAAEYEAMNAQASAQVQELNPELFVEEVDANGNVKVRPKSKENELVQDRAAIRRAFQQGKIWSGFKQLVARWDYTTITGIKDFARKRILHLGALVDLFDNKAKGLTFFTDNIYRPLNRMDEQSKVGYFEQMQNLDVIANSINGITKGYKQIRSMLQTGVHEFTINGRTEIYNADKLLRIYALSKNAVQREKLKKMGWDDAQIDKIKTIVGPQAIEFTDKLVDYLSNDYYESINNVYSQVNDVNLGYVPNYFPTITESTKVNSKLLEDGDFNGIFNAETAPALKERTDTSGLIALNYDFTDVLESHIVSMEKYKAYAEGVRRLNALFQNPSFNVLLEESGLKTVVKRSVNFAITPNAGQREEQTMIGRLMSKFTGFALAFKAIQIVKQATSFVNAYEDYNFFPQGSRVPGAIKEPINLLMFMVDSAKVIATMPIQIRNAYNMSANVRDRLEKGIEGDVYGLESGSTVFTPISKSNKLWARALRALKTGGAAPTVLGDILGVMGYMVNYNRNIANGMSKEDALEAFNNYNATAQSRRGTEKSSIQQNSSEFARAFTMFGSTTFLQINKVLQSQKNVFQALAAGKMPESKDIRAFVINLGVANALFVGVSNLAKFMKGDDDDREEALKRMKEALLGLNLIESIPLIGSAAEEAKAYIEGKKGMTPRDVVNPYSQVFRKMKQGFDEGSIWSSTKPLIEITIGAQLDPAIGLYNGFTEGFDEEAVYDILGISKSYRPTPMSKEDMKRYFPEKYKETYGPGGELYEEEEQKKAKAKQEREEKQAEKDRKYNYTPPPKPMNKTDMKRYFPEMYEQIYGPGGKLYEQEEAKKLKRKSKRDALREQKDRMYNYQEPPKKGSFGSQGFGEQGKKKSGFGETKFGGAKFGESKK